MLRTALVGYGFGGRVIHAPLIHAAKDLVLDTIVSSRRDDIAAAWPGVKAAAFEDILADPAIDLVVIVTPNDTHASLAHAALDTGKHVVVDKPFTASFAEAQALADHAARAGCTLCVFQNRRWDGHILTAKKLLAEGRLGTISEVNLRYDRLRAVQPERWGDQDRPGSGIWFNLGSHLVDQAVHLFGVPLTIQADIFAQRQGALKDDYIKAILGYDGFRVTVSACMIAPAPGPVIEMQGSRGAFVKYGQDTQEEMLKAGQAPDSAGFGVDKMAASFTSADGDAAGPDQALMCEPGRYLDFYESIAPAIKNGAPSPVPLAESLLVMRLLDLGVQSAAEGRRLAVA